MLPAPGGGHPEARAAGAARLRRLGLLVVLAVAAAWLSSAGCKTVAAVRLLRDARRPAHELAGRVDEREERVAGTAVLVYRPRERAGPLPGLVLVHGAVDLGARDVRMVALGRALALRGFHVACPDLPALRSFRADPADVDRIAALARRLAADAGRVADDDLALVGISIGGSYCLLAATATDVRERVDAVLAFGGYADLERLLREWMVAPRRGVPELQDPLVEGRRRVLLGNLEALAPPDDQAALRAALLALLAGRPPPAPGELSPAGSRLLACATSTEPIAPELADAVLAPMAPTLRALSPVSAGGLPAARVFLLHGESDPIVPPSDSEELRAALEPLGVRVRLHVTDVFTHVAAGERPSLWSSWALAWFVAGFLSAAGA